MIVRGDYKYTWYEFHPPSLFNVKEDQKEERDLASDIEQADRLRAFEDELRSIVDPKATALRAKRDLGLIAPDGTDMTDSLIPWRDLKTGHLRKFSVPTVRGAGEKRYDTCT